MKIENSGTGDTYADGSLADKFGVIRGSKNAGFPGIIIEHAFIYEFFGCGIFVK